MSPTVVTFKSWEVTRTSTNRWARNAASKGSLMRKILICLAAIAVLAASAAVGDMAADASGSTPTTAVTGAWTSSSNPLYAPSLKGTSHFIEKGKSVTVHVVDFGLTPNRAYFTVLYGNNNCDPAQAFPIGPFMSDAFGRITGHLTVQDTTGLTGGVVAATGGANGSLGSISTRIGDTDQSGNPTDQDLDGKFGASDVVAVPGMPAIGLVQCDSAPVAA